MTASNPDDCRIRRWDARRAVALCLTLLFCPVVYSLHLTSFLHAKEAVLAVGLCLLAGAACGRGRLPIAGFAAFLPWWTLLACAALVHLVFGHCYVPTDAVVEIMRWVTLLLVAALSYDLLANPTYKRWTLDAVTISAVAVALLGIGQYAGWLSSMFPVFAWYNQRVYSVFGNQDLFGGYMAIAIPVLITRPGAGKASWFAALLALVALGFALIISASRSAWLAALVGIVYSLAVVKPPRRWLYASCGAMLIAVAVGWGVQPRNLVARITNTFHSDDHGARLRLWFWDGALRMAHDHVFVGVGPGNFAYWSPQYMGEALHAAPPERYDHNELLVDHPHSEPLGLVTEFGTVGAVCGLWMLARLVRCGPRPEWGGLLALLTFSLVNAPFHSAPHAVAGLMLAGCLLQSRSESVVREWPAWVGPIAATGAAVFFISVVLVPSWRLREAEDVHLAGQPPFQHYARCTQYPWPNATADLKCGIALLDAGRYSEARRSFMKAMKGTDTGELYLALALLETRAGDYPRAQAWLEMCFWRWPSSRDAWYLLAIVSGRDQRDEILRRAAVWLKQDDLERLRLDLSGR